jgi:hypothetical protein
MQGTQTYTHIPNTQRHTHTLTPTHTHAHTYEQMLTRFVPLSTKVLFYALDEFL